MDDFESNRPPVDDLRFLDDLDQGLDLAPERGDSRIESPPPKVSVGDTRTVAAPLFPADLATSNRRPLLDLFPPPPGLTPVASVPTAQSARPSASVRPGSTPDLYPSSFSPERGLATYETFYGLREKPFSSPDVKFLYHSVEHDRASQELYVSIVRHDGLAILTGDAGTGKTMLCRALLDRIDRRTMTSFVADPFVTLEDLLRAILFDFGVISRTDLAGSRLSTATRQELISALHEFLLSLVQINAFAVVFIDDAQALTPEMLAQIQDIADTDHALMGIVLIGQPELLPKVDRRKAATGGDRVSVRARLDPLGDDEIAGYVLHRVAVSGAERLSIEFEDAALSLIYQISRGVPQLVNLLCDRALARGFEAAVTVIDGPIVTLAARDLDLIASEPAAKRPMRKVWAAAVIVGLMLLGAAASAFLFRAQLTRAVAGWKAPQPSPPDPALRTAPPIEPRPPSQDEQPSPRERQ